MEIGQAFQEVFKSQVDAAKAGGTQAVSGEVADIVVDTFYDMFGDTLPKAASLPWVRINVAPLLITSFLMLACKIWPNEVPKSGLVGKLAHSAAIDKWRDTAKPMIKYVRLYVAEVHKRIKAGGIMDQLKKAGVKLEDNDEK
mgnify:CR=1 FL=1